MKNEELKIKNDTNPCISQFNNSICYFLYPFLLDVWRKMEFSTIVADNAGR